MKKWHVALAIAGIIYLVLLFFLVNNKEPKEQYLFLSENTLIVRSNGKWKKSTAKEISDMTFYENSKELGVYSVKKSDFGYEIYDKNGSIYSDFSEKLTGTSKQMRMTVSQFHKEELNDKDLSIVNRVLEDRGIHQYSILTSSEKISFDFDHDGQDETIYAVSNAFGESEFLSVFSFVFMLNDGKAEILYEETGTIDHLYEIGRSYLHTVLEDRKNHDLKLVIGVEYFSNEGTRYIMLHSKNNQIITDFNLK